MGEWKKVIRIVKTTYHLEIPLGMTRQQVNHLFCSPELDPELLGNDKRFTTHLISSDMLRFH